VSESLQRNKIKTLVVSIERIMRARHELNRSQCMSFPSRRKRYFSEKVMSQQAGEDHGSAISCVHNQGVFA
jgi:hypothetical protein